MKRRKPVNTAVYQEMQGNIVVDPIKATLPRSGSTLGILNCSTRRLFAAWYRRTRAEDSHGIPRIGDFASRQRIKIASRDLV
jgi:hypothetical protein